jgi:hypothetical protein
MIAATIGGPNPPPTNSSKTARPIRIRPPWGRWMNQTAQTPTANAAMIARTPVTAMFGTSVIAGSPDRISNPAVSGHDSMTTENGRTGPWRSSPIPCSIPANAAKTPNAETTIRVAVVLLSRPACRDDAAVTTAFITRLQSSLLFYRGMRQHKPGAFAPT